MIWIDELDGRVRVAFTNSGPFGDLIAIAYVSPDEAVAVANDLAQVAEQMLRNRATDRDRVLAAVSDLHVDDRRGLRG